MSEEKQGFPSKIQVQEEADFANKYEKALLMRYETQECDVDLGSQVAKCSWEEKND